MSLLALALLSATPSVAVLPPPSLGYQSADSGFSYRFVDFGIGQGNFTATPSDLDSDDLRLGGSFPVGESLYLFASHTNYSMDVSPASLDLSILRIGVGTHMEAGSRLDLYASAAYADMEVDLMIPGLGSGSGSESGYALAAGFRAQASDLFELGVGIELLEIDNADDTILTASGSYSLTDRVGLGLSFESGDDFDSILLGLRVYL